MHPPPAAEPPLFAGLKVIDCATYIAAPTAATVLADFGAEVIKIEAPGDGDPWRNVYLRRDVPGLPLSKLNYPYLVDNRNKRALVLDLKAAEGRAVLERLVAQSDVFVTNLPLSVRARLGVRYADFAAKHPRLIYASFTAYGEEGEEAEKTGFDNTAYWGRSGLMDEVRADPGAEPASCVGGMGDHPSGVALYAGIVTALYRRAMTGSGGEVRSSLLANGMWANSIFIQASLCGADIPPRPSRRESTRAVGNLYRSSDGRWFMLALTNETRQWPALAAAVGRPELAADPRFAGMAERAANARALGDIFDAVFADRPLAEWRQILDAAGITFGIVGTTAEAAADPQAAATGILRPIQHTGLLSVDSPFTLTEAPKVPINHAPPRGADSSAILRELGYVDSEIDRLRQSAVIAEA
ncbi:MAG: CoA transferase [Alphaproteobacteria bacterium]|nr:CoA transferase [Alphaproteobacteria bacterium]